MLTIEEMKRLLAPMNLSEVARQAGLSRATVAAIAAGRPGVEYQSVARLAEYLEKLVAAKE